MGSEPKEKADTRKYVREIALSEPAYAGLARFARRIADLLRLPGVKTNPEMLGTLDDLLGAIYALIIARERDFTNRTDRRIEIAAVERRAMQLADGRIREDGKWMAGFHFNSAMFRMSAVYHRVLQIVTGKKGDVGTLRHEAEIFYRRWRGSTWAHGSLHAVHGQVTDLKHTPHGTFFGRRRGASYEGAVVGMSQLLDLIEAWAAKT